MSLVAPHRLLFSPPLFSPRPAFSLRRGCCCRFTAFSAAAKQGDPYDAVAILWFKQDLRVDDHPGLIAASRYRSVVPLYVFDRRLISRFSDEMLDLLLHALRDLKSSLRKHGSDLLIRFGNAENVIQDLVKEVNATSLLAEEEVEFHMLKVISAVRRVSYLDGNLNIELWKSPLYDLEDLPDSYEDFKRLRVPLLSPILCQAFPAVQMNLDWGQIPLYDNLKNFINENPSVSEGSWTFLKETAAESILRKESNSGTSTEDGLLSNHASRKSLETSVFVTSSGNIVGGGTGPVLNALAAYLRYLEGTSRGDWQEVHDRMRKAESREGASFYALFGPALSLGILSRRRVYYEAIKYERERNAGFLSPFGYSAPTVAAAAEAACSMEWYWLMSLRSREFNPDMYAIRIWRWKGYLIQYTVVGDRGPAILLVHGFGAFLEHFRDNISGISDGCNRVWAITLLGFGRSEKPNIVYTELMWTELLRDFIIEVVGEPVHLLGNSIGGYITAILAALWPALVRSVVLVNSAGDVIPGSFNPFPKERQTSGATWLGARLLLFYLRTSLAQIVKKSYPTKTERADEWLITEMLRASYDPGVLFVLESVFSFDLSIPLNHLLRGLSGKILIIQGMKDPISDSKSKLAMIEQHCAGVLIRRIDAGHCPHDELPEVVNSIICEWVVQVENELFDNKALTN